VDRTFRYPVACVLGVAAARVVAVETRSPDLLAVAFALYAVSTAVVLRYPVLTRDSGRAGLPAGLYGGGATAGVLTIGNASAEFGLAAAVLGLGLATFGLAMGAWITDDAGDADTAGN